MKLVKMRSRGPGLKVNTGNASRRARPITPPRGRARIEPMTQVLDGPSQTRIGQLHNQLGATTTNCWLQNFNSGKCHPYLVVHLSRCELRVQEILTRHKDKMKTNSAMTLCCSTITYYTRVNVLIVRYEPWRVSSSTHHVCYCGGQYLTGTNLYLRVRAL